MRTFLLQFLEFLLLLAVVYHALFFLCCSLAPSLFQRLVPFQRSLMTLRMNEASQVDRIDLLFVGSSHVYRGFDTRLFEQAGRSSFNLGSSSQTPIQSQYLLQRLLPKIRPKRVVLEVYPGAFAADGLESTLDLLSCMPPDPELAALALSHWHLKAYHVLLFSIQQHYLASQQTAIAHPPKDQYIPGGFVERALEHFRHKMYAPAEFKWNARQFQALDAALNFLNQHGTPYLLVQAPVAPGLYQSYQRRQTSAFDQRMRARGPYLNFNELLELNDSLHFYDEHHLNQRGVEVFNQALIEWLED